MTIIFVLKDNLIKLCYNFEIFLFNYNTNYINKMIALRNIASLVKTIKIQPKVIAPFSSDRWKERDEASEKVYISKAESNNILIY